MADNNKPQSGNLTSNSLILAALVATGTAYIYRDAPLQTSRPALHEAQLREHVRAQDVDARLWQDPYSAVAQATGDKPPPCSKASPDAAHCEPPNVQDEGVLTLAITASAAPYYEDVEFRRRLRYAVLAGLERAGFRAFDSQHLDYWRPRASSDPKISLPGVIPFESFRPKNVTSDSRTRKVVLLWVNEDIIADDPIRKLALLSSQLKPKHPIRILGPQSSDTLAKMAAAETPGPTGVGIAGGRVYSYGATAAEEKLKSEAGTTSSSTEALAKKGITLVRTVGPDDRLADAISGELAKRGITPGERQHIALVSELDTLYGQSVIDIMEKKFKSGDAQDSPLYDARSFVHKLGYLRGLDGALPPPKKSDDKNKTAGGAQNSGDKDSDKKQTDARALDLPYGQSQFDYLRRLADQLRVEDKHLRSENKDGIRAIGVLGSDVFDKLLVLRALKPAFPNALFFTTDFDTILTTKSELDWTRNLILASSLGPELRKELQGEIPPFRSSYQTSAFLATQLAIAEFDPQNGAVASANADRLKNRLGEPLIFQISGSGEIRALRQQKVDPSTPQAPCNKNVLGCDEVRPPTEEAFVSLGETRQRGLAALLALAGAAILGLAYHRNETVRGWKEANHSCVDLAWIGMLLVIGGASALFWESFAGYLTQGGEGEALTLTAGASVWPSIAIGVLATLVSLRLIWRATRALDINLANVAEDLKLEPRPDEMIQTRAAQCDQSLAQKIGSVFAYRLRDFRDPQDDKPYDVGKAWENYVYQGRFFARMLRSGLWSGAATGVFLAVLSVSRYPAQPIRGDLTRLFASASSIIGLFVVSFLVLLVLDATLFCLNFVGELARGPTNWPKKTKDRYRKKLGFELDKLGVEGEAASRAGADAATREHASADDLSQEILDDWIDLTFIEKRTECIGSLVYYPFVAIALAVLAQSSIFTPYRPDPLAFAAECLGLLVLFGCALALRRAAEKARENARRHLTAAIVRTNGQKPDGDWKAEQLKTLLTRLDDLHLGAFSPLSQQPFVRALLIPLTSFGWTALFDM